MCMSALVCMCVFCHLSGALLAAFRGTGVTTWQPGVNINKSVMMTILYLHSSMHLPLWVTSQWQTQMKCPLPPETRWPRTEHNINKLVCPTEHMYQTLLEEPTSQKLVYALQAFEVVDMAYDKRFVADFVSKLTHFQCDFRKRHGWFAFS